MPFTQMANSQYQGRSAILMSPSDHQRRFERPGPMSALPPIATVKADMLHLRFVSTMEVRTDPVEGSRRLEAVNRADRRNLMPAWRESQFDN
jgi:hypothetical protein